MRLRKVGIMGVALVALLTIPLLAQSRRDGNLKVGNVAPDFTIQDVAGKQTVKLSALRGKAVVLIFGSCT